MTILLVHAAATLTMTGVIWFVQLVHYPLFRFAAGSDFVAFEREHQRRTTWVVAPLMLVEAGSALLLIVEPPTGLPPSLIWMGAGLLALIWLSTAALQIPLHRRLGAGWDAEVAGRLVATNWIRTLAWSARAVLSLMLLT